MTSFIQPVSNVNGAVTVSPLHALGSASQVGLITTTSVVTPSSITTLGASSNSASLTYDAISLLQSFVPTFSVSGLTPAQQQQLALALGLSANASSTDLTNAINALLTPANPADALVNVLVGGATTETTNSIIPSFLNTNGEIAGVPATTASQVSDAVFATLLDTGTTTATTDTTQRTVAAFGAQLADPGSDRLRRCCGAPSGAGGASRGEAPLPTVVVNGSRRPAG